MVCWNTRDNVSHGLVVSLSLFSLLMLEVDLGRVLDLMDVCSATDLFYACSQQLMKVCTMGYV
jgi:hypothetical protein